MWESSTLGFGKRVERYAALEPRPLLNPLTRCTPIKTTIPRVCTHQGRVLFSFWGVDYILFYHYGTIWTCTDLVWVNNFKNATEIKVIVHKMNILLSFTLPLVPNVTFFLSKNFFLQICKNNNLKTIIKHVYIIGVCERSSDECFMNYLFIYLFSIVSIHHPFFAHFETAHKKKKRRMKTPRCAWILKIHIKKLCAHFRCWNEDGNTFTE